MAHCLAVVAEEQVEAFLVGIAAGADWTEPPLAHRASGETGVLKHHREGWHLSRKRVLTFLKLGKTAVGRAVATDLGVA